MLLQKHLSVVLVVYKDIKQFLQVKIPPIMNKLSDFYACKKCKAAQIQQLNSEVNGKNMMSN